MEIVDDLEVAVSGVFLHDYLVLSVHHELFPKICNGFGYLLQLYLLRILVRKLYQHIFYVALVVLVLVKGDKKGHILNVDDLLLGGFGLRVGGGLLFWRVLL